MNQRAQTEIERTLNEANLATNKFVKSRDSFDELIYRLTLGRLGLQTTRLKLENQIRQLQAGREARR